MPTETRQGPLPVQGTPSGEPPSQAQQPEETTSQSVAAPTDIPTTAVTLETLQRLLELQTQTIMAATQQSSDLLTASNADICRRVAALETLQQTAQPTVFAVEQTPFTSRPTTSSGQPRLKLKPFNGETPLDLYLQQVDIISDANHWTEDEKARAVIAQLDGPALSVLHALQGTRLTYAALITSLRDRFGDEHLQQAFYAELRSRRQEASESFPELAASIERLTYKSFPGATSDTLNRVGTAAFVDAIGNPEVQKFVRLARPETIRAALGHAMEMSAAQWATSRMQPAAPPGVTVQPLTIPQDTRSQPASARSRNNTAGSCYRCGRRGHFAAECSAAPATSGNATPGPWGRNRV